jgi:hypothetical protein
MKLELVSAWEIPIYSYASRYGFPAISEEMMKSLTARAEATWQRHWMKPGRRLAKSR